MRLLVVEDEPELARLICKQLGGRGFAVDAVETVEESLAALDTVPYDLVLLDLRLPDGDGLEVLRHLRTPRRPPTPVIVLTARDAVADRVRGLDAGADDYLTKPFAMEELVARLNAILRRPGAPMGMVLRCGNVEFDSVSRSVTTVGRTLVVPRRELMVLETLMRRAGRVVSRDALESAVYAGEEEIDSNALEVHVSRLRRRLAEAEADIMIHTVRGVGWLLKETA